MTSNEFFELLVRYQSQIKDTLTPSEYRAFLEQLLLLQTADDELEARGIVLVLKEMLDQLLLDLIGNAIREFRWGDAGVEARPSPQLLAELIEIMRAVDGPGQPAAEEYQLSADSQAVFDQVRRRLLEAPTLRRGQLPGDLAVDPAAEGLIELIDPEHGECYPAFQFDPADGRPRPVVLRINRLLHADRDPWAAADWWLGGSTWLDGPPAAFLEAGSDQTLEQAARALLEAD